jgi:hypothetical protein
MLATACQTQHCQCYFHIDHGDRIPLEILDDSRQFHTLIFLNISPKNDATSECL